MRCDTQAPPHARNLRDTGRSLDSIDGSLSKHGDKQQVLAGTRNPAAAAGLRRQRERVWRDRYNASAGVAPALVCVLAEGLGAVAETKLPALGRQIRAGITQFCVTTALLFQPFWLM